MSSNICWNFVSIEKKSEIFKKRIFIWGKSRTKKYFLLINWWNDNAKIFCSSLERRSIRKEKEIIFIEPSFSWILLIFLDRHTIIPILRILLILEKSICPRSKIRIPWKSLSSYTLDHIWSENWVCQNIEHQRVFLLRRDFYNSTFFRYNTHSAKKCSHLIIRRIRTKCLNSCNNILDLNLRTIRPLSILESTAHLGKIADITIRYISLIIFCIISILENWSKQKSENQICLLILTIFKWIWKSRRFSDHPDIHTSSWYTYIRSPLIDIDSDKVDEQNPSQKRWGPDDRETKSTQIHENNI